MSKELYIAGLDIGTHVVRAIQAKFTPETGELNIIGAAETESHGVRRGNIVDIEESVSCISKTLERLERMTGVPVVSANVTVSGSHITSQQSHGVIAVSRADGEIAEADIIRCVDASQAISIPQNREVLHIFPKTFTLDGQTGIRDPLGMSGIRLEVDSIIVQAGLPFVKNLTKAIMQAGVEIEDMVLAPLSAAEAVLSKRQKDLGVCLIDLGAGTTSMAVYEEGDLLHTTVLPIGSQHITNDIAIGLRCGIETAEKVKLEFGASDTKSISKDQEIDLSKLDPTEEQNTTRGYVVEIIEARLEEIFSMVYGELKKIARDGKLPSGVVLTGGGANLPGIVDFAKKHLRLPASLGQAQNIHTIIDRVQDVSFASVCGLVLWGGHFGKGASSGDGISAILNKFLNHPKTEKIKGWFKSFLP